MAQADAAAGLVGVFSIPLLSSSRVVFSVALRPLARGHSGSRSL